MNIVIGAILDVYFEGEPAFRACVFDIATGDGVWVINLTTGDKRLANKGEYEATVIDNIFSL